MNEETGERSSEFERTKSVLSRVLDLVAHAWTADAIATEIWDAADSELRIEPVKHAFEQAAIGDLVEALGEVQSEEAWNITQALFFARTLSEARPEIRQLLEYLRENSAFPMYTSYWVVETIQARLKPYELEIAGGSRAVGGREYAVDVVAYFVPGHAAFRLEFVGGDEIEVRGFLPGDLTLSEAKEWVSRIAEADETEWDDEDLESEDETEDDMNDSR